MPTPLNSTQYRARGHNPSSSRVLFKQTNTKNKKQKHRDTCLSSPRRKRPPRWWGLGLAWRAWLSGVERGWGRRWHCEGVRIVWCSCGGRGGRGRGNGKGLYRRQLFDSLGTGTRSEGTERSIQQQQGTSKKKNRRRRRIIDVRRRSREVLIVALGVFWRGMNTHKATAIDR